MAALLLNWSLCILMVIHVTSSQPTYDVSDDDNSCPSTHQLLSQLVTTNSQLKTAASQFLEEDATCCGRKEQALSALTSAVSELRTDVAELKFGNGNCHDRPTEGNCFPILVQQNINNGSSAFNRSWHEYKVGFNHSDGSYWIGNERLHQLTLNGRYKLRFDLQSRSNSSRWFWVEYSTFIVLNEAANYRLHIAGFTGNTGHDAMARHNGMMFTTYDRDNDLFGSNCAKLTNYGGFWYKSCSEGRVTSWGSAFGWDHLTGPDELRTSRMQLVCP